MPTTRLSSTASRHWSFDAVELDESSLELKVAGRPVTLQPLALSLLRCLLHAAPEVVSREHLLLQLWRRNVDQVSRNVLSNAAARLRQALGPESGLRIVTVAGIGYRFDGPFGSQPSHPEVAADIGMPQPARDFIMRQWFGALGGRNGFDPQLSLCDVLRQSIDRAESELVAMPSALASLHRQLAEHDLLWSRYDSAARHLQRALALQVSAGLAPADDEVLQLRFDLCRAQITGAATDGNSPGLGAVRGALKAAHEAMRHNPQPSAMTRLKAACADSVAACFDLDWAGALQAITLALRLAQDLPGLPAPQRFALHRNHGVALARRGDLAAGIGVLETLLAAPNCQLAADDSQLQLTRLNLGQFQRLAGRTGDAVRTLQALRSELPQNALSNTAFGVDTEVWLAKALLDEGRDADAWPLLLAAHERARRLKGPTSELALGVLQPLTGLLCRRGAIDEALGLLEQGVAPRLTALAMPGQREAVMALACWIQTLWTADRRAEARALLPRLRTADVRAAALRPGDAEAIERWRGSLDTPPGAAEQRASVHRDAAAGIKSIKVWSTVEPSADTAFARSDTV